MSIIFDDEFHGHGGSFVADPKTGKRTRKPDPTPAAAPEAREQEVTTKKAAAATDANKGSN